MKESWSYKHWYKLWGDKTECKMKYIKANSGLVSDEAKLYQFYIRCFVGWHDGCCWQSKLQTWTRETGAMVSSKTIQSKCTHDITAAWLCGANKKIQMTNEKCKCSLSTSPSCCCISWNANEANAAGRLRVNLCWWSSFAVVFVFQQSVCSIAFCWSIMQALVPLHLHMRAALI